jgi:hypothetical protein
MCPALRSGQAAVLAFCEAISVSKALAEWRVMLLKWMVLRSIDDCTIQRRLIDWTLCGDARGTVLMNSDVGSKGYG